MKKIVLALVSLFLLSAQVPLPQGCNAPLVPSGLDSGGVFTCRQLNWPLDLSFAGIYGQPTISSTEAEVNLGNITLILGTDPGYKPNYWVQITTPVDQTPFMYGVIRRLNSDSGQTVMTVGVFRSQGGGIYNQWNISVIGIPPSIYPVAPGETMWLIQ